MLSEQASPAGQDAHGAHQNGEGHGRAGMVALAFASVGVVCGDIGTSPLYALREALTHAAVNGDRERRRGDRHRLAADLGDLRRRHRQIRLLRAAGRQSRRRRHAGADGAGAESVRTAQHVHLRARHHRRGAVHRRRHDHAGDFGAVGGRGPETRHAAVRALRHRHHAGDPRVAVRGAAVRHGGRGAMVRPDHGGVVPRARRARACLHIGDELRILHAFNPDVRAALPVLARGDQLHRAGRGLPRRDRRRGALRRHGPFRPQADPAGVDRARVSLADPAIISARAR